MDDTYYNLVIGNIDESKSPAISNFRLASVEMMAQTEQNEIETRYKRFKIPEQLLRGPKEECKEVQNRDMKLESDRNFAISGEEIICQGRIRGVT